MLQIFQHLLRVMKSTRVPNPWIVFFHCFCRCYCKLGEWHEGLFGLNDTSIPQIISYYAEATKHDKTWYKAWHSFAYLNFEAVLFYKQQKSAVESAVPTAGDTGVKSDDARDDVSVSYLLTALFSAPCNWSSSVLFLIVIITIWCNNNELNCGKPRDSVKPFVA